MNDIASPDRGYKRGVGHRNAWFSRIFSLEADSLDDILALILCMAPNLQLLDLDEGVCMHAFKETLSMLSQPWTGEDAPFSKVKTLKLAGHLNYCPTRPLLPSMTSLELKGGSLHDENALPSLFQPLPMPAEPLLRRLVLIKMSYFTPVTLILVLKTLPPSSLRELIVDESGLATLDNLQDWDFDRLTHALKKSAPELDSFHWTNQPISYTIPQQSYPRFRVLRSLDKLRTLSVDFDLLVPMNDRHLKYLATPEAVFPPHLENLTLEDCSASYLNGAIEKLHQSIEDADDLTGELTRVLTYLACKFPLKRLALTVRLERYDQDELVRLELEPSDVVFFRYAADVLLKTGLIFEVYRFAMRFDEVPKLLVKHDYTAPLPHSLQDMDQDAENPGSD